MSDETIRPAYSTWPEYNRRLRDVVGALTEEQLALRPSPERWPLWATVGHTACQRVFWLCDFAGQPGAETTPFTNAVYDCPGDDDLEHVLSADQLADALDSTFRVVETCLDSWSLQSLEEELRRPEWNETWVHTRGAVIQRGVQPRRLSLQRAERDARRCRARADRPLELTVGGRLWRIARALRSKGRTRLWGRLLVQPAVEVGVVDRKARAAAGPEAHPSRAVPGDPA